MATMTTQQQETAGTEQSIQSARDVAQRLTAELIVLSRLEDASELRKRAAWAAADADELLSLLSPLQV